MPSSSPSASPMQRIGFFLGSPDINGGTYVIYEHASRLLALGYRVAVITKESVSADRHGWHPAAAQLEWVPLENARQQRFDILIATWWESVFLLHQCPAARYVYFVQSIESRFWPPDDPADHDARLHFLGRAQCDSTYTCQLPVITEASWIQRYLHDQYNHQPYLVRNGIRKDIYTAAGDTMAEPLQQGLRVLVEGPVDVFYKNVPRTVDLCRQAGVEEIWLLTSSRITSYPGVDRVFSGIPVHATPSLYRSCDVLVKLSFVEGMFGPPLEMFHCGGTAIVYDVTGHEEYIVHNENALVVPRDDEAQVVASLQRLRVDKQELTRLRQGAKATAEDWPDWATSSREFQWALQQIAETPAVAPGYLKYWTKRVLQENESLRLASEWRSCIAREGASGSDELQQHDNFVQMYYWSEAEGFQPQQMAWVHYRSDTPATICQRVTITGLPFWIRLDPSVRPGILHIYWVEIRNIRTGDLLYACRSRQNFDALWVGGTARFLARNEPAVLYSFGEDPQIILPSISSGKVGDELDVIVSLTEMSIGRYLRQQQHTGNPHDRPGQPQTGAIASLAHKIREFLS